MATRLGRRKYWRNAGRSKQVFIREETEYQELLQSAMQQVLVRPSCTRVDDQTVRVESGTTSGRDALPLLP